jgi:hypothetical protein
MTGGFGAVPDELCRTANQIDSLGGLRGAPGGGITGGLGGILDGAGQVGSGVGSTARWFARCPIGEHVGQHGTEPVRPERPTQTSAPSRTAISPNTTIPPPAHSVSCRCACL